MKILNFFPLLLLPIIFFSSCAAIKRFNPSIRVLHYNIYELDSEKLAEENNEQLRAVKYLLEDESFNIFSINELQFDRPQTPKAQFITYGENLNKVMEKIAGHKKWNTSFFQANTGNKAKKRKGRYVDPKDKKARKFADPVNYGLFPGQYSSGLATTYEILEKRVITNLPWAVFNPKIKKSLSKFRDGNGKRLPKMMPLFDKNFVDTIIQVEGKKVHLITLHTVPSYHFGNKKSPNYERNADQLRFLEWYLTGKTDFPVDLSKSKEVISSLQGGETFIAMGDWNTDITNIKNPGSQVLKRLAEKGRLLPSKGEVTHESHGFHPERLKMSLDYIAYSDDLVLEEFKILRPKEGRLFLGCGKDPLPQKEDENREHVSYYDRDKKQKCHLTVSKNFQLAKEASDHFPLLAKFNFK